MTVPLREFRGNVIYLDTMLPYALLRGIDEEVKRFFERIEGGEIQAYTSVLTFDELAYRLILALVRDRYDGSPLDLLRQREEELLNEMAPLVCIALEELSQLPNLNIVEVTVSDLFGMTEAMRRYRLRPRDGLHYAVMSRMGCSSIASTDPHFDRVPSLTRYTL